MLYIHPLDLYTYSNHDLLPLSVIVIVCNNILVHACVLRHYVVGRMWIVSVEHARDYSRAPCLEVL